MRCEPSILGPRRLACRGQVRRTEQSGESSTTSAIQLDALRNEFHRLWSSPSPEQAAPADATAVAGIVEDEADRLAALTLNELLAS